MIKGYRETPLDSSETRDFLDCEDGNRVCKGRKAKDRKIVKCYLVDYYKLLRYLRDNEYIVGSCRAEWPLKQILLSMFTIRNQTLNAWTHLVGFSLFLFLAVYTATRVPVVVDVNSLQSLRDMFRGADWHKIQEELWSCFPSMPNMPDPHRLKDVLKISCLQWIFSHHFRVGYWNLSPIAWLNTSLTFI